MNIFYVMFTDADGCPSLLHAEVVAPQYRNGSPVGTCLLWCCCAAFAHRFTYADALFVAKLLKGEAVLAETYEGKLKAWSEKYD